MQNDSTKGNSDKGFPIDLALLYHVAFRQKWKLIVCVFAGLVAAATSQIVIKPVYQSSARLLIRYISDAPSVNPLEGGASVRAVDARGEMILSTEQQILQSLDIMKDVARSVTPERILAALGGGTNVESAASYLARQLSVSNPSKTAVITVSLRHPDPSVAMDALNQLIDEYQKRHKKIHGSSLTEEALFERMEGIRGMLKTTQEQLREERQKIGGVLSAGESEKNFTETIHDLKVAIAKARSDRAAHEARIKILKGEAGPADEKGEALPPDHAEKVEAYQEVVGQLKIVRQELTALSLKYTPENPKIKNLKESKKQLEADKERMEKDYPMLTTVGLPLATGETVGAAINKEIEDIQVLDARVEFFNEELTNVVKQFEAFDKVKPALESLVQKRNLEDNYLKNLATQKDSGKYDMGAGFSNIQIVENATSPSRNVTLRQKALLVSLLGGLALGILLALLSEFFIDQTIKRPEEIESGMNMPLFLSIPAVKTKVRVGRSKLLPQKSSNGAAASGETQLDDGQAAKDQLETGLSPFFGALRDRTIMYLERLTHKPKLIAVTGCSEGAGVSTIATGLAKALSETAEGRVLLVDMNRDSGTVHPFLNGKEACTLADVLELDKRQTGFVKENLYMATTTEKNEHALSVVPKRFSSLVPKIKASDYDYVIFDMPPVSSLSVTPRLAGLMDIVLLVVDSEKTQRNSVRRANATLQEAKANVRAVLNNHRTYIPKWLYEDT